MRCLTLLFTFRTTDLRSLIKNCFSDVNRDFHFLLIDVFDLDDLVSKTIKQTEERVSDVKRRAEEAVSDVKRQAVVELQKAVRAAEEKANEAVGQTQSKVDKAVMEARRQAIEETLGMINRQSDSSEVSSNCVLQHD